MARGSGTTKKRARRGTGRGSSGGGGRRTSAAKNKGGKRRLLPFLLKWTAVAGIWATVALAGVLGWYAMQLPDVERALAPTRKPTIWVLAADGSEIGTVGDLHGMPVTLEDVPPTLSQAVIATEDRRFYDHFGLDPIGLARAMLANIRAGRIVQGGSTLTQQVAKNLFLGPEQTYSRKIQEAMLALWLEHRFTKDQILTIYLNRVYLGAGTYGVDAAARKYFGKAIDRLTLWESAMLAGLLKAPSRLNPIADPKAAEDRTQTVLASMVDAGFLTQEVAANAHQRLAKGVRRPRPGRLAPHFVDWVVAQTEDYTGPVGRDLVIETTLDPEIQRTAERGLAEALNAAGAERDVSQGAVLVMTPDGSIKAMVGGRDWNRSQFNRATQARRQPGSAFKPVVYLAALEAGLDPSSVVLDAPVTVGKWQPDNFDGKYRGEVTVEHALAHSLNTAAVRVAHEAGVGRIKEQARKLGVASGLPNDLSIALGTGETTLLDLTAAYAAFANAGVGVFPHAIREIRDAGGAILYRREGSGPGRVASENATRELVGMMAEVVESGTGRAAKLPGREAAGKTGTSQNFRDAWFMGFTTNYVAGVWMGNDDGRPMKQVTGGSLPARVWQEVMLTAHQGVPIDPLPIPAPVPSVDGLLSKLWSVLKPGEGRGGGAAAARQKPQDNGSWYQPGDPTARPAPN